MNKLAQYTRIEKLFYSLLLLACIYFTFTFLLLALGNFWPGPLFDYWIDIPLIEKSFTAWPNFTELVTAHNNAHRILIPRLLFIFDHHFFAGTNILLVTVSLLCKAGILLLINIILRAHALPAKLMLNALIFSAVLNASNVYNVIFNFDIQWDLVSVFACYSIYFYTRIFEKNSQRSHRILAYLFLSLAFLSHAGALSLPIAFILISVFNKKTSETIFNIVLMTAVFVIHSQLPFADIDKNLDTLSAFASLFILAPHVAAFITKCISGSLVFYLGNFGYYFSAYVFLLMTAGIMYSIKNRSADNRHCNNIFLYFSLFFFLMITTIAAARTMFTPHVWAASRFQTTVLLFIVCLHIHAWLCISNHFTNITKRFFHAAVALHGFSIFFMIHYFSYNIPYKLSNAVFYSHAYMLTHERNQYNAPRLLFWIHDEDVIANSDSFYRKNGLAWYADKQVTGDVGTDFMDAGKQLISPDHIPEFAHSCKYPLSALEYQQTPERGIEFSAPVDHHLIRKTHYAIDENGNVAGFGYVFVNEDGFIKNQSLKGYAVNEKIAFFVDINNNHQPECLYSVVK